jgi:hypothetical protein
MGCAETAHAPSRLRVRASPIVRWSGSPAAAAKNIHHSSPLRMTWPGLAVRS